MVKPRASSSKLFAAARSARHRLARRAGADGVVFMTDCARVPDPCAVAARLPRGSWVIVRDYGWDHRAALARSLRAITRERRQGLLVAGDPLLAHRVAADGLHLPRWALADSRTRRAVRHFPLVTAACHDVHALARAARLGVSAVLMSPVFATGSHPGAETLRVHRFARLAHLSPLPVVALGGIDARTAVRLSGLPVAAVAAIGALADGG